MEFQWVFLSYKFVFKHRSLLTKITSLSKNIVTAIFFISKVAVACRKYCLQNCLQYERLRLSGARTSRMTDEPTNERTDGWPVSAVGHRKVYSLKDPLKFHEIKCFSLRETPLCIWDLYVQVLVWSGFRVGMDIFGWKVLQRGGYIFFLHTCFFSPNCTIPTALILSLQYEIVTY